MKGIVLKDLRQERKIRKIKELRGNLLSNKAIASSLNKLLLRKDSRHKRTQLVHYDPLLELTYLTQKLLISEAVVLKSPLQKRKASMRVTKDKNITPRLTYKGNQHRPTSYPEELIILNQDLN